MCIPRVLTEAAKNAFFYDSAEGLIASVILLVSEFCPKEERHIVSVFKIILELLEKDSDSENKETYFHKLMRHFHRNTKRNGWQEQP